MPKGSVLTYLSKSLFIKGHQCKKALWLRKYQPECASEPDTVLEERFRSGHEVGRLAQQLRRGGIEVPYDGLSHAEQLAATRKLLDGGRKTIYEATFEHDGIFVKVDILHRGAKGWEILEVKGTTGVEEHHFFDAAIQCLVVAGAGLDVAKVALVHLNNQYVRHGALEVRKLFTIADITEEVREMQANVAGEVADLRAMLAAGMPAIEIGPHCNDPYECDFHGHCWAHVPEDSVFDLRERGVDKHALYRQGIVRQADIPLEILNAKQRHQVESTLRRCDTLRKKDVRRFLDGLAHPVCYLDFETVNPAIPPYDDLRPFQHMPFQYSLFIQETADAELVDHEFLAQPGVDPREELTEHLLEQIPEGASIVAWYDTFEKTVLRDLADHLPAHAARIEEMRDSFHDPMRLFRARSVYLWQQKGSSSLKTVLPLLVPELSYDGLEVADGSMAMDAYRVMCDATDPRELARIRAALLEYCKLDTLGMVRIVAKLREMVK